MLIRILTPVWKTLVFSVTVLGGILVLGGVVLAFRGGAANTSVTMFGSQFSSTRVGIGMAFIGAVMIAVVLRRLLSSVDKIAGGEGPAQAQ